MRGLGWTGVEDVYDEVLVYGGRNFVDHESEYGAFPAALLRLGRGTGGATPTRGSASSSSSPPAVAATEPPSSSWARSCSSSAPTSSVFAPGPTPAPTRCAGSASWDPVGCTSSATWTHADTGSRADAILCMAGYNSTLEALAAGRRPILMPRRNPRREQAIRAAWLEGLGLADVVEPAADPADVAALLQQPRVLAGALAAAGIDLDGANNAARRLRALITARSVR